MPHERLIFAAPAPFDLATGGYVYDRATVRELQQAGWQVDVVELPAGFPKPTAADLEVVDRWLQGAPNVPIVVDGLAYAALGALAERYRHRGLIALVHHPLGDETGVDEAEARRLLDAECAALGHAAGVIVTSPYTKRRLEALGVTRPVVVVEPGVDPKPAATGGDGQVTNLLCVASFTPRKGYDVLFQALATLADLQWRLTAVGATGLDPAYEADIRRQAAEFAPGRIELHGAMTPADLDGHFASADLFVFGSWYEGYGMVLAEAQAWGLPIVATAGGASADTVRSGAGLLVEPGDANALASALRRTLVDGETRDRLAEAARRARTSLPSWSDTGTAFAAAVQALRP